MFVKKFTRSNCFCSSRIRCLRCSIRALISLIVPGIFRMFFLTDYEQRTNKKIVLFILIEHNHPSIRCSRFLPSIITFKWRRSLIGCSSSSGTLLNFSMNFKKEDSSLSLVGFQTTKNPFIFSFKVIPNTIFY